VRTDHDIADLEVIILSYGHDREIDPLIDDLLGRQGLRAEQITVVHNPFDAVDRWTPAVPPGVRLIRLEENRGYAGGMNAGARSLDRAGWRLLLTHDARLGEDAVAQLVSAGRSDSRIGVVGPHLRLQDGTTWSAGVAVRSGIARHVAAAPAGPAPVDRDAVDGTIMLVRAEALDAVGGFQEHFFMYWEETELCLRVRRAGWRVVLAPEATAVTRPGSTRRHAVHAYLLTRNGLAFGWAAAGAVGIAGQFLEAGRRCFHSLPSPIRERWRDGALWRAAIDRTLGTGLGALDFLRQRWGKPPAALRRRSDVS
jgi:N-acetylglucosaminyl-diphospho-decaprenol L-rhamnosyltransferase